MMNHAAQPELLNATEALVATIRSENAALAALDFKAAVGLLATKQLHGQAFMTAQARAVADELRGPPSVRLRQLARELGDLSSENKRLLERALVVQGRVIASLARAVPRARAAIAGVRNYSADGRLAASRAGGAMALSARA